MNVTTLAGPRTLLAALAMVCTGAISVAAHDGLVVSPADQFANTVESTPVCVGCNNYPEAPFSGCDACDCAGLGYGDDSHGSHSRPDDHGPAAIVGDHFHAPGEFMVEYKYINMRMAGSQMGTQSLTPAQVTAQGGFGVVPLKMNMEMHMLHFMYGVDECVNVYVMSMLMANTMDHVVTGNGSQFTTHNSGFSDTVVGMLFNVHEGCHDQLLFNLGVSIPTGDIDRRAYTTPLPVAPEFPYPMRLGTGTANLMPAFTYKYIWDYSSFGFQGSAFLPLGRNSENYSVGDQYRTTAWYAYNVTEKVSLSYRVEALWVENYDGRDANLDPGQNLVYTNRPDMRGGEFINFGYGANTLVFNGHRLGVEIVHPVYQNLDGFQLAQDWTLFTSWSKAW